MIKQGSSTARLRKLSWAGLSAVCGMAALLLPVVPTVGLAQEVKEEKDDTTPRVEVRDDVKVEEGGSAREASVTVEVQGTVDETKDGNRVIVEKSADGKVLRRIELGPDNTAEKQSQYIKRFGADTTANELAKARAEVEHLRAQLKKAEYQLAMLQAHNNVPNFQLDKKDWSDGKADQRWSGKSATVTLKPSAKQSAPAKQSASEDEREARLQKLEENLSMLLKEVKSLRDEKPDKGRATEQLLDKVKSKPQPKEDQDDPKPGKQ